MDIGSIRLVCFKESSTRRSQVWTRWADHDPLTAWSGGLGKVRSHSQSIRPQPHTQAFRRSVWHPGL